MRRTILVLATIAGGLLASLRPGVAQEDRTLLGVGHSTAGPITIAVPMRRIEIGPAPEFPDGTVKAIDTRSALTLEIRSRYGRSLDYFYYQAEVRAASPSVASRIKKVEYIDHWNKSVVVADAASRFRRTHHTFGVWTLRAKVTLTPRIYIPKYRENATVELMAEIPYPVRRGRLPDGLRFVERSSYVGNGRSEWTVKLEGPRAALAHVVAVEYTLHPSFPRPTRTAASSANGFELSEKSWGAFRIHIKVLLDDGVATLMHHDLRLSPSGS